MWTKQFIAFKERNARIYEIPEIKIMTIIDNQLSFTLEMNEEATFNLVSITAWPIKLNYQYFFNVLKKDKKQFKNITNKTTISKCNDNHVFQNVIF